MTHQQELDGRMKLQVQELNPASRSVVMFSSRESAEVLSEALHNTLQAAAGHAQVVHLLVNGNPALCDAMLARLQGGLAADSEVEVRLWNIPLGDKAHAWNQFFHHIWSGESLSFFVDGYVRPNHDALRLLADAVMADPHLLGGTGVPTVGRTARHLAQAMIRDGGFHGNLCCIKGSAIETFRERGFRIPLGMYRTDPLVAAVLCFSLDPAHHDWDVSRIHVHPRASWLTDEKRWWRWQDIRSAFKRVLRQQRGLLENQAVKQHLAHDRLKPETLPRTASDLVLAWQRQQPVAAATFMRRHPLTRWALNEMSQPREWGEEALHPICLWPDAGCPVNAA